MNYALHIAGLILFVLLMSCLAGCVTIREPVMQKYTENEYVTENRSESYSEVIPQVRTVSSGRQITPYILWSNPGLQFGTQEYLWYQGYDLSHLPANSTASLKILLHEQKYYENTIIRVFDMTPRGHILAPPQKAATDPDRSPRVNWTWIRSVTDNPDLYDWLNLANIKLNFARFLGGRENLWSSGGGNGQTLEFDTRGAREVAIILSGATIPQNIRMTVLLVLTEPGAENLTVSGERLVPYQREVTVEKQRIIYKERQAPFWEILLPK